MGLKTSKLAQRIAKKLLANGSLIKGEPEDYAIIRTRAGRHGLAGGAFSWEFICIPDPSHRWGCFERAADIVKEDICIVDYEEHEKVIVTKKEADAPHIG